MKVAIIGNQNNNNFVITRYLRDEGFNATLCLLDNEDIFYHPSADSYDDSYKEYTIQFQWGNYHNFLEADKEKVLKDLAPFDFIIGVGTVPAFLNLVGKKLDIFVPCGGDISTYPFIWKLLNIKRFYSIMDRITKRKKKASGQFEIQLPKSKNPFKLLLNYIQFSKHQKAGIKEAEVVLFDKTNDNYEKVLNKLRKGKKRIVSAPPMLYTKMYNSSFFESSSEIQNHINYKKIKSIKGEYDFIVLQYCRQSWVNTADWVAMKGNDKLIRGFKLFLENNSYMKTHLILYEHGADVEETKRLIIDLGIGNNVTWFSTSSRKYIMPVVNLADVIVGELENSWLTYGIVLETLCLNKWLIHKRTDSDFLEYYSDLYPMIYADSDMTVSNALQLAFNNRNILNSKGFNWLHKHCINKGIDSIAKLIENKKVRT